jgi:hypothetical protein
LTRASTAGALEFIGAEEGPPVGAPPKPPLSGAPPKPRADRGFES